MFKRLRWKFLVLNITVITLVTLASFAAIYLTTYTNIRTENIKKLESEITRGTDSTEKTSGTETSTPTGKTALGDLRTFRIKVDKNGGILSVDTQFDIPSEICRQAAKLAWNQKKNYSVIHVGGWEWMYMISPLSNIAYDSHGGAQITSSDNYTMNFLDVTDTNMTLLSLLYTFAVVALVMLFVITAISFYFTNRAIKPIAEAWKKQKQFVADASHELKTPLTIIKSNYGVLLASKEETIESQMKWFMNIDVGTNRMSKLIDGLLDLATIDNMNTEIQNQIVDVSATVKNVVLSMEAQAVAKDIHLSSAITPNIKIDSNTEAVAQVVTILLDNAIRYTDPSGKINVTLTKSKNHVTCSVKNSGEGIAVEDLPHIFDRFYRTDSSRNSESGGYGLGLSIAQATAEKLGGKLYAKSTPGESTTFDFVIKK